MTKFQPSEDRNCRRCGAVFHVYGSLISGDNPKFCGLECKKADTQDRRDAPLTHDRLIELLSYDPETGEFRWRDARAPGARRGSIAGHIHKRGYVRIVIDLRNHSAHRLAWFYVHGAYPPGDIDHRDRVRHNNAIDNLRAATGQQNQWNTAAKRTSKTGLKGAWPGRGGKYIAAIQRRGRQDILGYFDTPEEAHAAYAKASAELHGEFARTG